MSTIGTKIRAAREAKGLSQEMLAGLAGVSQTTIDKIERGLTKRSRLLHYIANPLGLNVQELDPEMYGTPPQPTAKQILESGLTDERITSKNLLPLYAAEQVTEEPHTEVDLDPPLLEFGRMPLDFMPRPEFLNDSSDAYAVYISDTLMAPEFSVGDVVFVDPRLPFVADATLIFLPHGFSQYRVIGRLITHSPNEWEIMQWQREHTIRFKRFDWPRTNRIVAKYYRR